MFWVLCAIAVVSGSLAAAFFHLSEDSSRYRRPMWSYGAVFVLAMVGMILDLVFGWTP